jgi:hypothetical protein
MLRLIGNEYKKLYKNTGLLFLILALLVGKGAYLLWEIHYDDAMGHTAAQERDLFVKMRDAGEEKAVYLQRMSDGALREMRQIAERAGELSQGEDLAGDVDGSVGKVSQGEDLAGDAGGSAGESTGQESVEEIERNYEQKWREYALYKRELEALEFCGNYEETLEELSDSTGGLLASTLGRNNAYLKKYQEKICRMYADVERREIWLEPSAAVCMLTEFSFSDIFVMLFLAVLVLQVVYRERSEGTGRLILCTKKGFRGGGPAKLAAVNTVAAGVHVLFSGVGALVVQGHLGLPAWDTPVQCMEAYYYCPYNMTVGGLLVHSWLWKLAAWLLVANVFFMVASLFKNMTVICLLELALMLSQVFSWERISYGMWFGKFREFNVFALLSPGHYYEQAVCVNLFQTPVEIKAVGAGFFVGVTFVAALVSLISWYGNFNYEFLREKVARMRRGKILGGARAKMSCAKRGKTAGAGCEETIRAAGKRTSGRKRPHEKLGYYERKRLWVTSGAGVLLVLTAMVQFVINDDGGMRSETEMFYQSYCEMVEHRPPEQVERILEREEELFAEQQKIVEDYEEQYLRGELSVETFAAVSRHYEIPAGRLMAFGQIRAQYQAVRSRADEGEDFCLFYETGWEKLLGTGGVKGILADVILFLVGAVLCVCQFETMEFRYQMPPLIRTKRNGGMAYARAKGLREIAWGATCMLVLVMARVAAVQWNHGIWNVDIMGSFMREFSFAGTICWNIPIVVAMVLLALIEMAIGALGTRAAAWIAGRAKNLVNAVAASAACLILPLVFVYVFVV